MAWSQKRMFKEEDTPKNYEIWVDSTAHGGYLARRLNGVYNNEKDKAANALEKHLNGKNSYTFRVKVIEVE